jgi:predicted GNAT family N-acyltransferase
MEITALNVQEISAKDTYPIRKGVLRKGIPLPYQFHGDRDKDTIHLGTFNNGELIAIASFMKSNNANFKGVQYQLRGMATLESHRGRGSGKMMMRAILPKLRELGVGHLWCNARIEAIGFYKKQGLQIYGDPFEVAHIGTHYVMFKKLE